MQLLSDLYTRAEHIYLRDITHTSLHTAQVNFVFGHNPRTRDLTHVGAAEMLAGLAQAGYCMTAHYYPQLLNEESVARTYFKSVDITFSKMLAPMSTATLTVALLPQPDGLPRFEFDGFIKGAVDCGISESSNSPSDFDDSGKELSPRVTDTLRAFYNNGSELTLKSLETIAGDRRRSTSLFPVDTRLKRCSYITTTQLIVGLSQLAFAVVGETNASEHAPLFMNNQEYLNSMGDQALVRLLYTRKAGSAFSLKLGSDVIATRTIRGCKFVRLALDGDLTGTMDSMLSPRAPVKTTKIAENC